MDFEVLFGVTEAEVRGYQETRRAPLGTPWPLLTDAQKTVWARTYIKSKDESQLCGFSREELVAFRNKDAPGLTHGFDTLTPDQQAFWARKLAARRKECQQARLELAGKIAVAIAGNSQSFPHSEIVAKHALAAAFAILPSE